MRCPNCAANLADDSWLCSHCGAPVRPRDHVVQLELWGHPLQVLGWLLLACIVSLRMYPPPLLPGFFRVSGAVQKGFAVCNFLLALAGPWVLAGVCRWICRNLRFSDGARAEFSGRGAQIFGWYLLAALNGRLWGLPERWDGYVIAGALYFLGLWAALRIARWIVSHVELSNGRRFRFTGSYRDFIFWHILLGLSMVTIIGWAWVLAAIYEWLAEHTRAKGVVVRFHGVGLQILWRTLVAILLSMLIVPIPWAWLWYAQWLVSNVTIEGQLEEEFG